jgi:hypothetical protein
MRTCVLLLITVAAAFGADVVEQFNEAVRWQVNRDFARAEARFLEVLARPDLVPLVRARTLLSLASIQIEKHEYATAPNYLGQVRILAEFTTEDRATFHNLHAIVDRSRGQLVASAEHLARALEYTVKLQEKLAILGTGIRFAFEDEEYGRVERYLEQYLQLAPQGSLDAAAGHFYRALLQERQGNALGGLAELVAMRREGANVGEELEISAMALESRLLAATGKRKDAAKLQKQVRARNPRFYEASSRLAPDAIVHVKSLGGQARH